MPITDTVKDTARDEVNRVAKITQDAARSGAYMYPIKGLLYFLSHRSLWGPLMSKLVPALTTGAAIFGSMFFFTYLPQAAVLAIFNGPLAAVNAALLVTSEASTIFMLVSKGLLVEDALIDTFDGTLLSKGQTELVSSQRQVKSGSNTISRLGKIASRPFQRFTPSAIIRYFMYLPLNLIPIFGTVIFVLVQGRKSGPLAHARYFQLKGMSKAEKEKFIEERQGAYTSYGTVATLLEMVPIVGILFAFTNTVGAALWAADNETKGTTAPQLREQVKKAE